jgi:subtilisin family serine protease
LGWLKWGACLTALGLLLATVGDVAGCPASSDCQSYDEAPRLILQLRTTPASGFNAASTGFASLDALMQRYRVVSAVPLFNPEVGYTQIKRELGMDRIYLLQLPQGADLDDAVQAFAIDPYVAYAEPDAVGQAGVLPNDALFYAQWGLRNTGQTGGTGGADIDADAAWELTTGSSQVIIAVIDSGADLDHPDLVGKFVQGHDYVYGDNVAQDDFGHGTHVTGIAAANSNNSTGVAGVCWGCRVMPLKAITAYNTGYYSWWIQAIEYAVDHGADVINMSCGGNTYSSAMLSAVRYATSAGVPVVAAMMNFYGATVFYPAGYPEAIAVGATDHRDFRAWFSNYGNHIDLAAPGAYIWSTMWNDSYESWIGTSMATPHVSGVIGLIESVHPGYSVAHILDILQDTADDQVGPASEDAPGWDPYFGAGRLNAGRAVAKAMGLYLNGVHLSGPADGPTGAGQTFIASASPSTAGTPLTYTWRADGQTTVAHTDGQADSVTFTWDSTGVKTVRVTVRNAYNSASGSHTVTIRLPIPAVADFAASRTSGLSPLGVSFTNLTVGDYTSSLWDFGDGASSTEQNPTHAYYFSGVYTVTLTVNGPGGMDAETKVDYITVNQGLNAWLPIVGR